MSKLLTEIGKQNTCETLFNALQDLEATTVHGGRRLKVKENA